MNQQTSRGAGEPARFDVAVIGLGPVGAISAQLLALEGFRVLAVDAQLEPFDKPRAIGLDHEALRVLQKLGVAQDPDLSLGDYRTSEYRNGTGQLLRRIKAAPEPHLLAWPPLATFVQPQLESLLRKRLANQSQVSTFLGTRLVALSQSQPGVHLNFEGRGPDAPKEHWTADCDYVVGCDGASSEVREISEMGVEDLIFDEPWLVIDVLVSDDSNLPSTTVQFCDPRRPATFIAGPGDLRRWEIMLLPGEDPSEMTDEAKVWELLAPWIKPHQGKIWRAAAYRFHALVGEEWRKGRVFLAGDAAHQTPPFMGQGLNQGIRDAVNLCWKIGQVARHGADAALLDTYEAERRPNARQVIELTKTLGQLICEQDNERAALRDARLLAEVAAGKGELVRQDMLPPLQNGFLDDKGGRGGPVGRPFPQAWITIGQDRRRMDDVLTGRFLLATVRPIPIDAELRTLAEALSIDLVSFSERAAPGGWREVIEDDRLVAGWMAQSGVHTALVRPDHVVFGAGSEDNEVSRLVRLLSQRLANPADQLNHA